MPEKKYSLEELLNKSDLDELRDLLKAMKKWKSAKKDNRYWELKTISQSMEKIV